jgi:hypothetical protein
MTAAFSEPSLFSHSFGDDSAKPPIKVLAKALVGIDYVKNV